MRDPVTKVMWETSVSAVTMFLNCARRYYYSYVERSKEPKKTNYYLLMGMIVHDMVAKFHKKGTPEKPFYFKSVEAAKGRFRGRWWNSLRENADRLMEKNGFLAKDLEGAGQVCIENYWKQMFSLHKNGRGTPPYVEKSLKFYNQEHGFKIGGRADQIREIPEDRLADWNSDAVEENGKLKPGYLPHVIVDLKTGKHNYTLRNKQNGEKAEINKASLKRLARQQFALHESMQATVYTYLHERVFGALPLAFAYYHLRTGEIFPTHRTQSDYDDMFERIHHVRDNINSESFPKNEGFGCQYCEHMVRCRGERDLVIVNPIGDSNNFSDSRIVPAVERKPELKQLKMKLKVPRKKRRR